MFFSPYIDGLLKSFLSSLALVFSYIWWVALPAFLATLAWDFRLYYLRRQFVKKMNWKILEVKVPKEIMKSPKAMEQIFASMYSIYSFVIPKWDKYLKGKVNEWISFEMVGQNGGVHFYVYYPAGRRKLIESAIYAQYPGAEIHDADDYTEEVPAYLPNEAYDIWGTNFILNKENYLPIRTYHYFEEPQKEKRLDPLANIIEVMSGLKEGEKIWLQVMVSPTGKPSGNEWKEEGDKKIEEISGKKPEAKKSGAADALGEFMINLIKAPFEQPQWGEAKKEDKAERKFLNSAEQDVVKEISNKISKLGFETVIRFVYIDRKEAFSPMNISAVMGSFQQFNTQHLNSFRPGSEITLGGVGLSRISSKVKTTREFLKKRAIFNAYKNRRFGASNREKDNEKFPVLNVEELATIYHYPSIVVEAPKLRRLETKKGGAPADLPIVQ